MRLHTFDGSVVVGSRWTAPAGEVDARVLGNIEGPVLDVGCGPGRHVRALLERGVVALGIDLTPQLVEAARLRGVDALHRCVFGPVPASGRWRTVLLLDGNVGIGGDPAALLRRVGELLTRDGRVVVETSPPGLSGTSGPAHIEIEGDRGPTFSWQTVGADRLAQSAAAARMVVERAWCDTGRWFAQLRADA
jgi:SAM-dependent methyltransferase